MLFCVYILSKTNTSLENIVMTKCAHCQDGYVRKNGVYVPCKHCITPERFQRTMETAIKNCGNDVLKRRTLIRIKENLPEYPVMALMEAENYGKFSEKFITMLSQAYDIRPFKDVNYKGIN